MLTVSFFLFDLIHILCVLLIFSIWPPNRMLYFFSGAVVSLAASQQERRRFEPWARGLSVWSLLMFSLSLTINTRRVKKKTDIFCMMVATLINDLDDRDITKLQECSLPPTSSLCQLTELSSKLSDGHSKVLAKFHSLAFHPLTRQWFVLHTHTEFLLMSVCKFTDVHSQLKLGTVCERGELCV